MRIKKCRHCGYNESNYCEKCYQEVIAENSRLQLEIKKKEDAEKEICGFCGQPRGNGWYCKNCGSN